MRRKEGRAEEKGAREERRERGRPGERLKTRDDEKNTLTLPCPGFAHSCTKRKP